MLYDAAWEGTVIDTPFVLCTGGRLTMRVVYGEQAAPATGLPGWILANKQMFQEGMQQFYRRAVLHVEWPPNCWRH
jgi:hypothetical protein